MVSFKYVPILMKYYLTDSVFISTLLLHSILLPLQKLFTITGYNNLVAHNKKRFLISLCILSTIALVSFSSLKRFLISLIAV